MNAITAINPAPTAGPHVVAVPTPPGAEPVPTSAEGAGSNSIFSHRRQADFLSHLATFGNVRLAAQAALVSARTADHLR